VALRNASIKSKQVEAIGPRYPPWTSRCSVRRDSYSWRRIILPHLENTPSSLDTVTGTPAGDEGARQGGIREIDRRGVIQHAASSRRRHSPAVGAAILVEPSGNYGRRATCESCLFIDVREWHRRGWLRAGQRFTWSWTRRGEALGSIHVRTETDAVVLMLKARGAEGNGSKSVEQRVPLVWTRCHLGGARPWFRCYCRRRIAILYMRGASTFACRHCCGLAYASQREIPRHRAISRVQKIRMRLGGSANLLERFPKKPRGMHRWTYRRLFAKAMAAQERSIALELDYMRRHYPGLLSQGELRRKLISATAGCNEPVGGSHAKFLRVAGARGRLARRRRWGPRGVERSADDRPQRHREGAA
jgi:hypothetical protein